MNSKSRGFKQLFFSVVTVKDGHTKPNIGFKESLGVKFKSSMCTQLCLKLRF